MKHTMNFVLLCLLLIGCNQQLPEAEVSNEVQKIDLFLQDVVARHRIPGLTVAATRNDTILYSRAFGFRDIDLKQPMKVNNIFHWASVSKTFVGTAVLQLTEKGKIDLDEKLVSYLPYFKQKDKWYKDITIRQMLNHTSGIGDVEDYEWDHPQNDDGAPERYVRSLANDPMLFAPGTDWSYSNTAYEILGVIISSVSGMSFEEYVRQNILMPLEMNNTSFIYPQIPDSLRVKGHIWSGKPEVSNVYPYNRIHAPSSTLNSNVLEMTHYAMANLHRGEFNGKRILSDSSYNTLWTNSVHLKDKPTVGVSWFLDEHRGKKTVAHSGGDTGFRSHLLLVPEKNISVEVVCNYELGNASDIALAVLDLLEGEQPELPRRAIGFSFAEKMQAKGLDSAKTFYEKTYADTIQRKYFRWEEDEGAFIYPAYVLSRANKINEALELLKFNLELNPNSGPANGHLGIVYAKSGNKEQALVHLQKALEIDSTDNYFNGELEKLINN